VSKIHGSSRRAFTLVELLVVIGIIAVLVGILLPVINSARGTATAVACQSNLRQLSTALLAYAAESKGSFPPGYFWHNMRLNVAGNGRGTPTPTPQFPDGRSAPAYWWQTMIHVRIYPKTVFAHPRNPQAGGTWRNPQGVVGLDIGPVFDCPSVDRGVFNVRGTYQANTTVMPNLAFEHSPVVGGNDIWANPYVGNPQDSFGNTAIGLSFPGFAAGPAKVNDLYADTAILWESPALFVTGAPPGFYYPIVNYPAHAWTAIDGGRLINPRTPYFRYRQNATMGANKLNDPSAPILFPTDRVAKSTGRTTFNRDYAGNSIDAEGIGGPRFRHGRNNTCNVAFADGSVRGLKITLSRPAYTASGIESADSEFLRSYLLTKPMPLPTGGGFIPENPNSPFGS
jgi:prepilin-type N-terminal cleavage/methylation domain-containing protein/prepilin-type processing-associated H-X9-DG protein